MWQAAHGSREARGRHQHVDGRAQAGHGNQDATMAGSKGYLSRGELLAMAEKLDKAHQELVVKVGKVEAVMMAMSASFSAPLPPVRNHFGSDYDFLRLTGGYC